MAISPFSAAPHQLMGAFWLASRGYDVHCVLPGQQGDAAFCSPLGDLKVDAIPACENGLGLRWHVRFLWRVLRLRLSADASTVFYVHGSHACPAAWLALAFVPGSRVVYHTQDFLEPGRHRHWEYFERLLSRKAERVICNDPSRARFMASHYRLRRRPVSVRTALPAAWPVPEREPMLRSALLAKAGLVALPGACLIWVGGPPAPVRCSAQLIEAVARLPREYGIVFSGLPPGSLQRREAEETLRRAGIIDRSVLLDLMPFGEMLRHAAACDLGMLLYPDDGVGNFFQAPGRLTEYVACGLPVVASDFPGLALVTVRHRLGETVEPGSIDAIRTAILRLGGRSEEERALDRARLRRLARSTLAYEAEAWQIEDAVTASAAASPQRCAQPRERQKGPAGQP